MKTVLLTAIGSFAADIAIKNLKKNGYKVVGCDIYQKEWIADAYNVDSFYQAPYVSDEEKYFEFIDSICNKENVSFIIPLTDIEVDFFDKHREWAKRKNITLCISSEETISICRNKNKFESFIRENVENIKTIPTALINNKKCPYNYPVVCKPYDGRSSQGLKYIYYNEEWDNFISSNDVEKYIVQPFINGKIITVDIVRQKDGLNCVAIPREELLRTLNGAGTSVMVFKDEKLVDLCKNIANKLNIIGCVNVEFIKDNNNSYYVMECNPRFSGGVEFSCLAGYDCISNHINSFMNYEIDNFNLKNSYYIARKYEEYITKID